MRASMVEAAARLQAWCRHVTLCPGSPSACTCCCWASSGSVFLSPTSFDPMAPGMLGIMFRLNNSLHLERESRLPAGLCVGQM